MRKLAITAFSFSAAIFASNYFLPLSSLWVLSALFAVLGLLALLRRQRWVLGLVLAMLGCSAGFLCFCVHAQITLVPAQLLDGETREIRGRVTAYPQVYPDFSRAEIVLEGEGLPRLRVLLYDSSGALDSAEPGDTISCVAKLKRADQRYGERIDLYFSRDVYLTAEAESEIRRSPSGFDLRTVPARVNRAIAEKVRQIFPADTAAFLKSLMLGDKQELYQDESLYVAMSRAGFLHVAAVSGLHIAFLIGLLQLLMGKSKGSALFCIGLVWFFVLVTGSSPSAVRAAVMQSFLLTAPLVNRENDPPTSLACALALILLFNPYAAAGVSLQLSFAAMAGILCLAEPIRDHLSGLFSERWAERLRAPISTVASSLAVMVFTVPLMAWHFGSVSLLSPLTNILGLWAVSLCFCGGYLCCLLGFLFLPLGTAAAWLVSWLARYLILAARIVSGIPFAVLYVRGRAPVLWIVLTYLLFLIAVFSRLGRRSKLFLPLLLSALCLAVLLGATRRTYSAGDGVISVIDVGQGQSVAVFSGEKTVVIDCGGMNETGNAGETAGSYLRSCGKEQIDLLLLTHLHKDHCNGVVMLMELVPVRQIILPAGVEDEDEQWAAIRAAAQRHGTRVLFLHDDTEVWVGGVRIRLFLPGECGDVNERGMMLLISLGDYDMLVTGDASKSAEEELLRRCPLRGLELLIVGHHGSRYASSGELLRTIGADTAVISVGNNSFGHPTCETLERLKAYGYTVYRTDLNGTIEFFVGDSNG